MLYIIAEIQTAYLPSSRVDVRRLSSLEVISLVRASGAALAEFINHRDDVLDVASDLQITDYLVPVSHIDTKAGDAILLVENVLDEPTYTLFAIEETVNDKQHAALHHCLKSYFLRALRTAARHAEEYHTYGTCMLQGQNCPALRVEREARMLDNGIIHENEITTEYGIADCIKYFAKFSNKYARLSPWREAMLEYQGVQNALITVSTHRGLGIFLLCMAALLLFGNGILFQFDVPKLVLVSNIAASFIIWWIGCWYGFPKLYCRISQHKWGPAYSDIDGIRICERCGHTEIEPTEKKEEQGVVA